MTMNDGQKKEEPGEAPVKVQMSNGQIRYGLLLDKPEEIGGKLKAAWRFISSTNLARYMQTGNPKFIELLPDAAIVSVDVHLK
jgi:hypothetical protein